MIPAVVVPILSKAPIFHFLNFWSYQMAADSEVQLERPFTVDDGLKIPCFEDWDSKALFFNVTLKGPHSHAIKQKNKMIFNFEKS